MKACVTMNGRTWYGFKTEVLKRFKVQLHEASGSPSEHAI